MIGIIHFRHVFHKSTIMCVAHLYLCRLTFRNHPALFICYFANASLSGFEPPTSALHRSCNILLQWAGALTNVAMEHAQRTGRKSSLIKAIDIESLTFREKSVQAVRAAVPGRPLKLTPRAVRARV